MKRYQLARYGLFGITKVVTGTKSELRDAAEAEAHEEIAWNGGPHGIAGLTSTGIVYVIREIPTGA